MKNIVLVTNNETVQRLYGENYLVEYLEGSSYLETLEYVRDRVHAGHKLLSHPLSGSVKPNETPYKTVVISRASAGLDFDGLSIIEESIASAHKFISGRHTPKWTDKVKADFRLVDSTIITTAIQSMDGKYIG